MKTIRIGNLEWTVDTQQMTWWEADQHAHGLAGQGWRLPTVQELVAGIDYDAMHDQERPEQCSYVWTRSEFGRDCAWCVSLSGGYVETSFRKNRAIVRLVREAQRAEDDADDYLRLSEDISALKHDAAPAIEAVEAAWPTLTAHQRHVVTRNVDVDIAHWDEANKLRGEGYDAIGWHILQRWMWDQE